MPVLLKGEKMKGKIIHWFISMMALVILFKPSFSFAYIFEGKDVGGSTVPPKQERYFNVNYHRVGYNEVVYRWNIGEIMAGNYCRQRAGVMNPVDKYWLEIKYFDTQEKNSQYFERRLLEVNNRLVTINDASSYQFAIVERGQSLTFDLRLKLKDTFLYNTTPSDISIPANTPLAIITMLCVDKTTSGNTVEDYQKTDNREYKYNSFSIIKITSADSATFSFARTCTLENNNQTIKLKDVTVKELNENDEVLGNTFDIGLNCPGGSVKNAYILFTDALSPSNTGTLPRVGAIGRLHSSETMATQTVLSVKDSVTKQYLTYRQPLIANGDFFNKPTGNQAAGFYSFNQETLTINRKPKHRYEVYYRKLPNSMPKAGTISAKMTYNIYYD
ncbi:fimbrial protein [Avibacterium paragallinarum]|uniref:fimbrial protein n=1 Tax=Avibacterium paragallinarum TaxID=728 RepID=UPI003985BC00